MNENEPVGSIGKDNERERKTQKIREGVLKSRLGVDRRIVRYSILQRYKFQGNMTWYGRISESGVIRYVSLKVTKKADAQNWLDMMNARKFLPEEKTEKDIGVNAAVIAYLEHIEAARSARTLDSYTNAFKSIRRMLTDNGAASIREITPEVAQNIVNSMSSEYSTGTARLYIAILSQFVKWALYTYEIEAKNPFDRVSRPKKVKREKSFWTPEEIELILDNAPDPYTRAFWSLMAFAGLRHDEACEFSPSDIKDGVLQVIGKGNKQAFVPVSERLKNELARVPLGDRPFDGDKYRKFHCYTMLHNAVKAAGIDGLANNHKFRHSFASNLIRSGVNIKAVQQLMRHENVQITLDTYSHLIPNDLKSALDSVK